MTGDGTAPAGSPQTAGSRPDETSPSPAPSCDATHDGRRCLALLALAGVGLIVVCLYWNRIALGGRFGRAPAWVADLARPIDWICEHTVGPVATDPEGNRQSIRIAQFLGSWTAATVFYFLGVWAVLRRTTCIGQNGRDVILAVAILCRVILVFSPSMLETDPSRYLWDGAVLASGINPYKYPPAEVYEWKQKTSFMYDNRISGYDDRSNAELRALARLLDDNRLLWHALHINHPVYPTIYPPVAQHLFSVAHRVEPGSILVLKALVVAIDLGILWLLSGLLTILGRPQAHLLVYGWCPLALKEYAQTGHYDVLATFCLLGTLYLLIRGRRALAGAYLGLAALGKLYPLIIAMTVSRRLGIGALLVTGLTVALFWAPFLDIGVRAFDGLFVFSRDWVMNASVFSLVKDGLLSGLDRNPRVVRLGAVPTTPLEQAGRVREVRLDSMFYTKAILGCAGLLFLVWLARRPDDRPDVLLGKAFASVGALFLLSPVGNPWYCAWLLPFAALFGRVSWVVLSATMAAYYAHWGTRTYLVSAWPGILPAIDLRVVEYLPFYALLVLEEIRARRNRSE